VFKGGIKNMNEINFRVSNSSLSSHNVIKGSYNTNINQVDGTNSNIKTSDKLRTQEGLISKYEQALNSKEPIDEKDIDKNQIKSKLEELINKIIGVLQAAASKVISIDQAKKILNLLNLIAKGVHISEIIKGIASLIESFPDLANYITSLMEKYSEIHRYLERFKQIGEGVAKLVKELSKRSKTVKSLLDSRVSSILENIGTKILSKLGPFAKIAGIIGTAIQAVLAIKEAADIIMSDKSIEEKGVDLADLIIRKALEIGGCYVFAAIGTAIGGPIGLAVGLIVGGVVGLVGGYDFLADKLKEIGATKVFADWVVTPVLKLFEKPSLVTNS
jgi:hypothetical protein